MDRLPQGVKRVVVAIAGGLVTLLGILLIPYPGPGWVIVFAGLAILATEFTWAKRLLDRLKAFYEKWQQWLKRQPLSIRLVVISGVVMFVIITLWLLNTFGVVNDLLNLNLTWAQSPLFAK